MKVSNQFSWDGIKYAAASVACVAIMTAIYYHAAVPAFPGYPEYQQRWALYEHRAYWVSGLAWTIAIISWSLGWLASHKEKRIQARNDHFTDVFIGNGLDNH
jgi:hypothetical protein